MTSVGIFASVASCDALKVVTHGISIEMLPLIPAGLTSAACSGKNPDSECPIRMAPFNFTASAAICFHVGVGCGPSVPLRSGIICL